eukprot:jgi/Astpho2/518/Aster-x0937
MLTPCKLRCIPRQPAGHYKMPRATGEMVRFVRSVTAKQSSFLARHHWTLRELFLCLTGTEELQILIIPGNPGAAGYYTPYMEHLHEQLRGRASIRAVSHLGHGPNSSRRSRQRCDLKQQILHKLHYVQQHMSPRTPLVLIGHSIGAFMALAVSNSLEQDPDGHQTIESPGKARTNSKVLALFPFFQTNPGDTEQFGYLMLQVSSACGHEMDEHAITTTLGMLSFVTVRSGFVLGQHEFRDLAAPADWAQLHRLGLGVIYGEKDRWLPRHQWQHFVDLPGLQGKLTAGHNHDFCVSVKSSQHIAELSAAMMEPVLSQSLKK